MTVLARTRSGLVQGGRNGGARHWLGIPYATAQRFGLPQPPVPWNDVKAATAFGPECPQCFGSFAPAKKIDAPQVAEACLVLNVWAPDTDATELEPVMVWIHGGAFMAGTGNIYDGTELAARGDIVIVTLNYRVGVLGFVNLGDALNTPELPSNLGLRDQIAALEWVRDNIAQFGGDPSRVTLAGESAGSISIAALLHCRRVWPLFHGAILQSGAISLIHGRERSLRIAQRYCEVLGLDRGGLEKLRSVGSRTLLEAQSKVHGLERGTVPGAPWFDGDLVPASLDEARTAATASVPIIAGFTRDEIRIFEWLRGPDILPMTRSACEPLLRRQLGQTHAERVLAAYTNTKADNRMLATHLSFGMSTLCFAERHSQRNPTWFYRFDYSHPLVGATHGLDLEFIWNFGSPISAVIRGGFLLGKRRDLTHRMQRQWTHFVRHGKPEADWPAYSSQRRAVRLFDLTDQIVDDPDDERRRAWNGMDISTSLNLD